MNKLRAYMASGDAPNEGAILVFARTADEAKREAAPYLGDWGIEWIDIRVKWMRSKHLYGQADPKMLAAGIPHVIERPRVCVGCELWGYELDENGRCENCRENEEDIDQ